MNYQWLGLSELHPIVEFHDIRAEKHKSDRYLGLVEGPLAAPFVGAGGALMGQFRVDGHPDRLVLLRGFPSMLARRKTLAAFHGGAARKFQHGLTAAEVASASCWRRRASSCQLHGAPIARITDERRAGSILSEAL